MTPRDAEDAVADQATVTLRTATGAFYAEGRIVSYSIVPTVTIITPEGERVSWRHDMADRNA